MFRKIIHLLSFFLLYTTIVDSKSNNQDVIKVQALSLKFLTVQDL